MKEIFRSTMIFLILSFLLGIIYPLLITGMALIIMPFKSTGSIAEYNGKPCGSIYIGQTFTGDHYFHSRPSAGDYNPLSSGGTNLGPTNPALILKTAEMINYVKLVNDLDSNIQLPSDMVTTSASGLDPHISINNALLQTPRVAKARGLSPDSVRSFIQSCTEPNLLGIWGSEGINVLKLNLMLDKRIKEHN